MVLKISLLFALTRLCAVGSDIPIHSVSLPVPRQISKESRSPSKVGSPGKMNIAARMGQVPSQITRRDTLPANFFPSQNPLFRSPTSATPSDPHTLGNPTGISSDHQVNVHQEDPFPGVEHSYVGTDESPESLSNSDAPDERESIRADERESIREIVTQIMTYPPMTPEQNIDAWIRDMEGFMRVYKKTLPITLSFCMLREIMNKRKMGVLAYALVVEYWPKIQETIDRVFKDPINRSIKGFILGIDNKENSDDLRIIVGLDVLIQSAIKDEDIQRKVNQIKLILDYVKKFRGNAEPESKLRYAKKGKPDKVNSVKKFRGNA